MTAPRRPQEQTVIDAFVENLRAVGLPVKIDPNVTDKPDLADHYFSMARKFGTSHRVYKTPWAGDPRVNIQNSRGKAKAYQVRQVLLAIERLENSDG